jgi:hypothetical protein
MAETDGINGVDEVKPNLGSPMNRPQSTIPEITTPMVLRQITATPFYIIGLAFNLLSELFTGIAERIDGSSSEYHSAEVTTFRTSDDS